MSRGLRFASVETMPDGLRQSAERAMSRQVHPPIEKGDARRNKYGNCPQTVDGIRFASKREARQYEHLKLQKQVGEVSYFLMQVPIRLSGGTRYIVDFQVFMADGTVRYLDAKGRETDVFKIKRREVQAQYPIRIETV